MSEFDNLVSTTQEQTQMPQQDVQTPIIQYSEDPKERQKQIFERLQLKTQILRWKESFPKQLEVYNYRMETLDNLTNEEMVILLEEMSMAVSTRNSSGLTAMLYFTGVETIERAGTMLGYQIQGVSMALQQNAAIKDCLNELMLKYEQQLYTPPELRLAYLTISTVMTIHKLNSNQNVITNAMNKKVPEDVANKYADL